MSDLFSSFSRFAKSFPKGSLIFAEFEPGSSFYLIQSGRVQLIKIINGFEKNLDILQPGEIFGEMAILDNSPRSASAIAYDDVMALEFNKENFEILMKGNPAIAMRLLKTFVRRIYAQRRRFMILTIEDRPARIADVFLMLDETQPNLDRTTEMRSFDTTIEEVARWAGLSKEETEDNMRKFIDQGRISVYDDRIIVQNMTDLTRYVNTRRSKEQNLYVNNKKDYYLPFLLTAIVIIVDQVTKILVVQYMSVNEVIPVIGDLVNFRFVYNTGAAFSLGAGFGEIARKIMLVFLPFLLLIALTGAYLKSAELTRAQRWFICGILGGGFGNLIDRFFRSEGVVDFIDVKFFGILGMDRWPTFNAADSFIVCCGIGLGINLILSGTKQKNAQDK